MKMFNPETLQKQIGDMYKSKSKTLEHLRPVERYFLKIGRASCRERV